MSNSADPDETAHSRLIWIFAVCKILLLSRIVKELIGFLFSPGKWNDEHCATLYGYVCKVRVGTTPTPIAPTASWIGYCPIGFSLLHNKCYRVFSQAVNWTTARAICRQQGPGYDLASVQNEEENGE